MRLRFPSWNFKVPAWIAILTCVLTFEACNYAGLVLHTAYAAGREVPHMGDAAIFATEDGPILCTLNEPRICFPLGPPALCTHQGGTKWRCAPLERRTIEPPDITGDAQA